MTLESAGENRSLSMYSRMTPIRTPSRRCAVAKLSYGWDGTRPTLKAVTGSWGSYPAMTVRIRATSPTVRHIGPARSFTMGWAPTIPCRLTRATSGAIPTTLLLAEGLVIEPLLSSAMAQVTRLAATAEADPPLEAPGSRSVSYGSQFTPPNELRAEPPWYSAMLDLARIIAPAARSFATNVASPGG